LLTILAHKGRRRPEPDADASALVNKRAFGGNAFNNIFGGQNRPPDWRIVGHGRRFCACRRAVVKTATFLLSPGSSDGRRGGGGR
jgi:hypothetical protein